MDYLGTELIARSAVRQVQAELQITFTDMDPLLEQPNEFLLKVLRRVKDLEMEIDAPQRGQNREGYSLSAGSTCFIK